MEVRTAACPISKDEDVGKLYLTNENITYVFDKHYALPKII